MKIKIIFQLITFLLLSLVNPQKKKFFVQFKDKDTFGFNPYEFFSPASIERRNLIGFNIYSIEDAPVKNEYVQKVLQICDTYTVISRWLNGIFILATTKEIEIIQKMPFVKNVMEINIDGKKLLANKNLITKLQTNNITLITMQHIIWETKELWERQLTGRGVIIAVLDDGFKNANKIKPLKHLFDRGKIIKTWDFWRKKEKVYDVGGHGTSVLTCIAGIWDTTQKYDFAIQEDIFFPEKSGLIPLGMAINASFILLRTEHDLLENYPEEEYWLAGVEFADKEGAKIINSSLGYNLNRYFQYELDGKISLVSYAARQAARRGILVINSAGNEGDDNWKFINKPADVDSILSVGGIDPLSGIRIYFTSYGPSWDKRLKPEIVGPGRALTATPSDNIKHLFGTSFAAPFITGIAACLWQNFPHLNNMQIRNIIMKSGYLYPYYDYLHGFGPPQLSKVFNNDTFSNSNPTFQIITTDTLITILPYFSNTPVKKIMDNYLFWHIARDDDYLLRYGVFKVICDCPVTLPKNIKKNYPDAKKVRIFFRNYIKELSL